MRAKKRLLSVCAVVLSGFEVQCGKKPGDVVIFNHQEPIVIDDIANRQITSTDVVPFSLQYTQTPNSIISAASDGTSFTRHYSGFDGLKIRVKKLNDEKYRSGLLDQQTSFKILLERTLLDGTPTGTTYPVTLTFDPATETLILKSPQLPLKQIGNTGVLMENVPMSGSEVRVRTVSSPGVASDDPEEYCMEALHDHKRCPDSPQKDQRRIHFELKALPHIDTK